VRVAVCTVRGAADLRAERLEGQGIEATPVTAASELDELGPDVVAWVGTAAARTWLAGELPAGRPWAATCAHAAAALGRGRAVIAELPGDPGARPSLDPDPAGRSGLVAPIDGVADDRVTLLADAFAHVPGGHHLVMVSTDPRQVAIDDPRIDLVVAPTPAERADLVRRAIAVVLAGRDRLEPTDAMEAFGFGTGVVAVSDGGADLELVRDEWTGRVVPGRVDALAGVLGAQVAAPEVPDRYGAHGRVLWELRSWERCRRRLRAALTIRSLT
jgi:glycosyltransferase involved in cell wall biosynthesis